MKKSLLFFALLVAGNLSFAQEQLQNASFENWTTNSLIPYDEPDNWWGTSASCNASAVCNVTSVKTNDAHAGTSAVQLVNITNSDGDTEKGQLIYMENLSPVPFTSRPTSLTGWYKFNKAGTDKITVTILLTGATSTDFVAYGTVDLTASKSTYTKFTVTPMYLSTDPVQHITVSISFNDNPSLSSTFTLDDLNLTYSTTPTTSVTANTGVYFFPNPSSESIRFEKAVTNVSVKALNGTDVLTGNGQTELLNISSLTPGVYVLSYQYNDQLIHTKLVKE